MCDIGFEYQTEYFALLKEAAEVDLLSIYLKNQCDFRDDHHHYTPTLPIVESVSNFNLAIMYEDVKQKKKSLLDRIIDGIQSIINAILRKLGIIEHQIADITPTINNCNKLFTKLEQIVRKRGITDTHVKNILKQTIESNVSTPDFVEHFHDASIQMNAKEDDSFAWLIGIINHTVYKYIEIILESKGLIVAGSHVYKSFSNAISTSQIVPLTDTIRAMLDIKTGFNKPNRPISEQIKVFDSIINDPTGIKINIQDFSSENIAYYRKVYDVFQRDLTELKKKQPNMNNNDPNNMYTDLVKYVTRYQTAIMDTINLLGKYSEYRSSQIGPLVKGVTAAINELS